MAEVMKEDLRTVRTKTFLSKTLLKLMEESALEKISVTDICDKAMVHRTTFYKHFEDKYHLLSYTFECIKDDLFKNLDKCIASKSLKDISLTINKVCMDFLQERQGEITKILKHNQDEKFYTIIRESFERSLKMLFVELKNEQILFYDIPIHILTTFIVGGFSNLALWHLKNPNNCTMDDLYAYNEKIVEHLLESK